MTDMFAVYGNCQSGAIATVLGSSPRFSEVYHRSWIRYCFEISEEEILSWCQTDAPKVSLLISQRLKNNWREKPCFDTDFLRLSVKPGARVLSYSDIYYRGYTPEWVGPLLYPRPPFCGYVNLIAQFCFVNDLGSDVVREFYTNPKLIPSQTCEIIHSIALSDLFVRERTCDVKTSVILAEKWRKKRHFIAYNHPTRELFADVCDQIYRKCGLENEIATREGPELLNDVRLFSPRSFSALLENSGDLNDNLSTNITENCVGGLDGFLSSTFAYYERLDRAVLVDDLGLQASKSNISWLLIKALEVIFPKKTIVGFA